MSSSPFSTTNTFCCGAVSAHEDHAYMHDLMIMGYGLTPFGTVLSYGCWLSSLTAGTLVDIWDHYSLLLQPTFSIRRSASTPRDRPELGVSSMATKLWPIFPFIHRANTGQVDAVRCGDRTGCCPNPSWSTEIGQMELDCRDSRDKACGRAQHHFGPPHSSSYILTENPRPLFLQATVVT